MTRRPARATQHDISRAIAAAAKAGATMVVDILPDGTIRLTPYQPMPMIVQLPAEPPLPQDAGPPRQEMHYGRNTKYTSLGRAPRH